MWYVFGHSNLHFQDIVEFMVTFQYFYLCALSRLGNDLIGNGLVVNCLSAGAVYSESSLFSKIIFAGTVMPCVASRSIHVMHW
jgi:hypothetical protein